MIDTRRSGSPTPRILYSLVLAAACMAVLAARVHLGFDRIRFRVVTAPRLALEPSMAVALPDLTRLAGSPSAIVLRLRGIDEPLDVTIALDGSPVARVRLPAQREIRVDASTYAPAGAGHQLVMRGDRAGWRLSYLEIANVYGFSRGIVDFIIVPRERSRGDTIPPWVFAPLAIGLLILQPRPDWPHHHIGRWLYRTGAAVVSIVFAVSLLADTFTRYKILLSQETFLLCAAVLYADPIAQLLRPATPYVQTIFRRWGHVLPHAVVIAVVLWSVGQFYRPRTGFTTLIKFGDQFEPTAVPPLRTVPHEIEPGAGYDGQFYAQLALDPFLRSDSIGSALDDAAYRGRRILLPWMAYLLGGGRPWFVLQAYALLNVACWVSLVCILLRWLPPGTLRPTLAWIGCALNQGLLTSIRESLPDGPSKLLLTVGVLIVERNRRSLAAIVIGLAGLARETNLLGGILLTPGRRGRKTTAVLMFQAALVIAPLILWMGYLSHLGLPPAGTGLRNFAAPLSGYGEKWIATLQQLRADGWKSFAWFSLLALIALTTQAAVLLWHRDWRGAWWRLGVAYLALMIVLGPAVWEGHPGAVTRIVLPMTLAFNMLLPRLRWFWPLWVLGNANVVHGLEVIRVPWFSF